MMDDKQREAHMLAELAQEQRPAKIQRIDTSVSSTGIAHAAYGAGAQNGPSTPFQAESALQYAYQASAPGADTSQSQFIEDSAAPPGKPALTTYNNAGSPAVFGECLYYPFECLRGDSCKFRHVCPANMTQEQADQLHAQSTERAQFVEGQKLKYGASRARASGLKRQRSI